MEFSPYNFLSSSDSEAVSRVVTTFEVDKIISYKPPQRVTPIYEIVKGAVRIGTYSSSGNEVYYDILRLENSLEISDI
ncbi:hypothetical protein [Algoriphagus persicinus]|uniref:hypothetical protein n=1 Tax=Algoriphagus persicinus TaxID=3108754 RepID=UPI002B39B8CE|nr:MULTISPECIES: hypothetical protein [unclassified Algoriphagus]MEB2779169.1 hypothetical protein [Algoriphagus sp. C2-6-M1]MEB2784002.1 hypothetical protein [Algoriphagus sp. E1-3-M2]